MTKQTEGSKCRCSSEIEHERMLARIDLSFKKDYSGERRRSAPTSETLRNKVLAHKATTNGHAIKV